MMWKGTRNRNTTWNVLDVHRPYTVASYIAMLIVNSLLKFRCRSTDALEYRDCVPASMLPPSMMLPIKGSYSYLAIAVARVVNQL